MNAAFAPGPFEFILLVLLGGGLSTPTGMPPTEIDPLTAQVAPPDCVFYTAWAGTGEADPNSKNHTEQLLAEPEVHDFLSSGVDRVFAAMGGWMGGDDPNPVFEDMRKLIKLIEGKPGAAFVSSFQMNPDQPKPPIISGGLVLRSGEDGAAIAMVLQSLQGRSDDAEVTSVKLAGHEFTRVHLDDDAPSIVWAIVGDHLYVGLGDGSAEQMLARAGGEIPDWLATTRANLKVPRPASVTYLNIEKIVSEAVEQGDDDTSRMLDILGIHDLRELSMVHGLDDVGCVTRALLRVEGKGRGLFAWMEEQPLTSKDVSRISRDSPFAVAFKLDPVKVFDLFIDMHHQISERNAQQVEAGIANFQAETGVNLRDDLLQSIGTTWRLYSAPVPNGLVSGWTISVDLRDTAKFVTAHDTLLNLASNAFGQRGGPQLETSEVDGVTIHTLQTGQVGVPFLPSWCVVNDEFIFSLTPGAIKNFIESGGDQPSLAEIPLVKPQLDPDKQTLAVVYVDTQKVANTLLPLVKMGLGAMGGAGPFGGDLSGLPSAQVVTPHLQPSIGVARRTDDGIEFETLQTLPGGNIGATAPVAIALLLPAVQSAREAARRTQSTNNMKQIGLAFHNFADVNGAFPAGYSSDAEGKPLLSWRVHILPYIEEQALYDQFHLDEPWDSAHNKKLIEQMPELFRSPNSTAKPGMSNYLGVSGADGIFVRPENGENTGIGFRDVTDGTSNTIMTVEVPDTAAMIWTKPGDFAPDKKNPIKGLLGVRPGGFIVGFNDGSVQFISENIDVETLKAFFTKSGGEVVQR